MTISWYSISISLQSGVAIFNGYFSVDNDTNLVTSFYETINGSTNFNNNILIPTGTGVVTGSYLGFTNYNVEGFASYDNAYLSNWLQFDYYGVIINSMSAYPQYNKFNLWATNLGDESVNNIGIVGNNEFLSSLFSITPSPTPTPTQTPTTQTTLTNNYYNYPSYLQPISNLGTNGRYGAAISLGQRAQMGGTTRIYNYENARGNGSEFKNQLVFSVFGKKM